MLVLYRPDLHEEIVIVTAMEELRKLSEARNGFVPYSGYVLAELSESVISRCAREHGIDEVHLDFSFNSGTLTIIPSRRGHL